jgi:RecB family exonuclease
MTEIYSHSKLETFEQCRLKYKYRYIDKLIPKIEKSIEAHLGSVVHAAFEWLYQKVMKKIIPSVDEFISFYSEEWETSYSPDMKVVNPTLSAKDYFNRGIEFLINYYIKHKPFKDNTIATEKKIEVDLDEQGETRLIGYIDRLVHNLEGDEIEIHDYKTSGSTAAMEKVKNGRQLALYSLAIKEIFGKEKRVSMVWHFLAHDMKVNVSVTNADLSKVREEITELIKSIGQEKTFPATKSRLCDWCEYRDICEAWKNKPDNSVNPENRQPKPKEKKWYGFSFEKQKKLSEF